MRPGVGQWRDLVDVADQRLLDLKAQAGVRGGGAIGGEPRDGLADLAEAEEADANGSDRAAGCAGFGARTRKGQVVDVFGESRVCTTLLISPR